MIAMLPWTSTETWTLIISLSLALIGALIKIFIERVPYQRIGSNRYYALKGTWKGIVQRQEDLPNIPEQFEITFTIRPGWWRRVRATSKFQSFIPGRGDVENVYWGGFPDSNHLILRYQNRDKSVNAFGGIILKLGAHPRRLEGRIIGHSSHIDRLFYSTVSLTKL